MVEQLCIDRQFKTLSHLQLSERLGPVQTNKRGRNKKNADNLTVTFVFAVRGEPHNPRSIDANTAEVSDEVPFYKEIDFDDLGLKPEEEITDGEKPENHIDNQSA